MSHEGKSVTREGRIVLLAVSGLIVAAVLFAASGRTELLIGIGLAALMSLLALWLRGSRVQREVHQIALNHKSKISGTLFLVFVALVASIVFFMGSAA